MTNETHEQTHPKNKTFRVSAAGIQVYVNSTAEVVNLVHELATKFGKLLPVQPNHPMHTEGVISRSDGALVCLEYRFAATAEHLETQPSTVPCRYCGRPVSPVGGRWSANPLVQKHLSGPLAYDERKMQIPTLAYQQLMRGGCVPPVSEKQPAKQERPAHETEAKSEPVEIPPPPKPSPKRVDEKPAGSPKVTKLSAPDEQAKMADVSPAKQKIEELPLPVNATFGGCDLGWLPSEKQVKRPWAAPKSQEAARSARGQRGDSTKDRPEVCGCSGRTGAHAKRRSADEDAGAADQPRGRLVSPDAVGSRGAGQRGGAGGVFDAGRDAGPGIGRACAGGGQRGAVLG